MNKNKIYVILLILAILTCIGCTDFNEEKYYDNHNTLTIKQNSEIEELYSEIDNLEVEAYDAYYLGDYEKSKEKYISYQTKVSEVITVHNNQLSEVENMYETDKINIASYDYFKSTYIYSISEYDHSLLYAKYMLLSIDATNDEDAQKYYELALYHDENSILNREVYNSLEPPTFY